MCLGLYVISHGDKLALIKEQDSLSSSGEAICRQGRAIDIHEIVLICNKDLNYHQCGEQEPFCCAYVMVFLYTLRVYALANGRTGCFHLL